jgi:hypothetical protein
MLHRCPFGNQIGSDYASRRELPARYDTTASAGSCGFGIRGHCGSAHHWARELLKLGRDVRIMPVAYVKPYVRGQNVNGGIKAGHWGGAKAGQFGSGSSRCAASGPAEMARVSQPGRTRHSGSADGFAGFGIGRSDFAPAARL